MKIQNGNEQKKTLDFFLECKKIINTYPTIFLAPTPSLNVCLSALLFFPQHRFPLFPFIVSTFFESLCQSFNKNNTFIPFCVCVCVLFRYLMPALFYLPRNETNTLYFFFICVVVCLPLFFATASRFISIFLPYLSFKYTTYQNMV